MTNSIPRSEFGASSDITTKLIISSGKQESTRRLNSKMMRKPKRNRKRSQQLKKQKREREYPGVKFDPRIDSLSLPELLLEAMKYVEDFPDAPMVFGIKSLAIRISQIDRNDRLGFEHIPVEYAVEMLRCFLSIAQDNPTCEIKFAAFGTQEEVCRAIVKDTERCDHEWVVYSTAVKDGCLMVQCVECGAHGCIDDPSPTEWSEAFHAPSNPYRWMDNERVNVRGVLPADRWHVRKEEDNTDSDAPSLKERDR